MVPIIGGDGSPPEPDWPSLYSDELDVAAAREAWGIALRELRDAGGLVVANGDAIGRLVQFRIVFNRASRQVAEMGAVLPAKGRRQPQYNPYWTVMKQSDEAIRVLEAELGIAPTRRGKITKVDRAKKASRAADRFLSKPAANS